MKNFTLKKQKKTLFESIYKELNVFFKKLYWFFYTNLKYFLRTYVVNQKRNVDNKISLLMITKNRSKIFEETLNLIELNTNNLNKLEILILIDVEEIERKKYHEIVNIKNKKLNIKLIIKDIEKNTSKINYLSKISSGDLLFACTDDMHLVKNWDKFINYEANKFKIEEPFCIWVKEVGFKYPYLHSNALLINKTWFNKCGFYLSEFFYHYFADNWLCDICRSSGKFLITKNFIWKHENPIWSHNKENNKIIPDRTSIDLLKKTEIHDEKKTYREIQSTKKEIIKRLNT